MTDGLLTSADPEPPRRTFVLDDTGTLWWRTDSDGIANRTANWCTVEHGCAAGIDFHDHESWTRVAGNYGPVRVVEPSLDHIAGMIDRYGLDRAGLEEIGAARVFELLAASVWGGDE